MRRITVIFLLLVTAASGVLFFLFPGHPGAGLRKASASPDANRSPALENLVHGEPASVTDARELENVTDGEPTGSADLIAGITGDAAYQNLRELIHRTDLSAVECAALCSFLREATVDATIARMASIKNSVMIVLANQDNLPTPWAGVLLEVFHDRQQHPVIRDYALQHLFTYYEAKLEKASFVEAGADSRTNLLETFWVAATRADHSFAGTALLGLLHLSTLEPAVDRGRLRNESLTCLGDVRSPALATTTALQVCALLREDRALARAAQLAQTADNIALRASGIAAVGALGGPDDREVLSQLLADENPSIRAAATAAMQALTDRLEGAGL